jgi:hypothetical protein
MYSCYIVKTQMKSSRLLPNNAGNPTLCIKVNVITKIEAHYGLPFPRGYRDWWLKKFPPLAWQVSRFVR